MHVLLFYPPVVLTAAIPKETAAAAASSIHRNAAETCSKKDYKNGVCIAPTAAPATATAKDSDLKTGLERDTIDAQDGVKGEGEGEAGVNVQPLRAMEKVVRDSAEKFRGRCNILYCTSNINTPLDALCHAEPLSSSSSSSSSTSSSPTTSSTCTSCTSSSSSDANSS